MSMSESTGQPHSQPHSQSGEPEAAVPPTDARRADAHQTDAHQTDVRQPVVRRAGLTDLDDAARLFNSYRQFYGYPDDLAAARSYLAARLEHDDSVVFLSIVDELESKSLLSVVTLASVFDQSAIGGDRALLTTFRGRETELLVRP